MRITYRGNFQPDLPAEVTPWSTETHIAASLEALGHEVDRVQENEVGWQETAGRCLGSHLFLWTSTHGYAQMWPKAEAEWAINRITSGMPSAGVHLDLWWGLSREQQVREEPFFRLGWLFTADGDHDGLWEAAGVRHRWMPPAVFGPECYPGTPVEDWASDVAFIGSWEGYGHAEWWPHRKAMLDAATAVWGDRVAFWPRSGRGAVRSEHLNNLLASVKVVLGDSCFADRSRRYFSDRVFETVGRGGFLVMPHVDGVRELLPSGMGVRYYPFGDHEDMARVVNWAIDNPEEREAERAAGMAYVRDHHTYEHRMAAVLATMGDEGAWG